MAKSNHPGWKTRLVEGSFPERDFDVDSGNSKAMTPFFLQHGSWWSGLRKPSMAENPHFKELLQRLNDSEARYLIVGGYAVMKYAEPRFTRFGRLGRPANCK